jgi:predicted translin family RNA/ssDNA-binding protein
MAKVNLDKLRREMEKADKVRESVIRKSRDVIKMSKTVIGAVHRDEMERAGRALSLMKKDVDELKKEAKQNPKLEYEGIFRVAIQEYVEALSLNEFVKKGKLLEYTEEFLDIEHYLMGLCDLSGELVRKAINSCIKEKYKLAVKIREFLEEIYVEMSKFELRNGELRRKYDGIKYDIKKLDDVVFQLKMKDKI